MATLFEGDCIGKAVNGEIGVKKGVPICRIEMEVTEGPHKGRRVSYEGPFTEKSIPYTKRAMTAVGWKGKSAATFAEDVKAANLTVTFEVEIASWQPPEGGDLRQWSAVRRIGGGQKPLEAIDADKLRNVDKWLSEVPDQAPANNGTRSDLPF